MHSRSDLNLTRSDGDFAWDGASLTAAARRFGTPLYIVNRRVLADSYRRFVDAFRIQNVDARVFFSLKTNPIPEVLRTLAEAGCGAEVVSKQELWLARRLGLAGERIIANGAVKPDDFLASAVDAGIALINLEDVDELRRLEGIAQRLQRQVNVGLRILPRIRGSRFDLSLATSHGGSPTGFIAGSEGWNRALDRLAASGYLRLRGLHFHLGSGIHAAKPYQRVLAHIRPLWKALSEKGFPLDRLDIGGGFSFPSIKTYSILEAARMIGWGKSKEKKPSPDAGRLLADVASACRSFIEKLPAQNRPQIFIEPGRALTAASQLLMLRVQAVKQNERGEHFALCDGGAMSLSPMLWSERHEILAVNGGAEDATRTCTLLGNMPAPFDIVAHRRTLPVLHPGDLIAVLDVGAYFTAFGNAFAGSVPAIAVIESGTARLIRPRVTSRELFERDLRLKMRQSREKGDGETGRMESRRMID